MRKEMIYNVFNTKNEGIYCGRLETKEIKELKSKGYTIVKTNSYVKTQKF